MKVGVVVFPGSNCDKDLLNAIKAITGLEAIKLWHKDSDLRNCRFICLPGGFSYGDYLRAGALAKHSAIMRSIIHFANAGGPVLGICNGFQILCESGLLPGSLTKNRSGLFICKKIYLKTCTTKIPLFSLPIHTVFGMSIAHAEGNYYAPREVVQELIDNEQVLLKYTDQYGRDDVKYNPNGSVNAIAGICNIKRNVIGLMPHPERSVSVEINGSESGKSFLSAIINSYR